jgi:hypothetical protein
MPNEAIDDVPSAIEHYKIIRSQIEHEDNLINQRLSWFVASQSFFFSAYAILLNAPVEARQPEFAEQQSILFLMIPIVAICTSVLIYTTITAAMIAMYNLRKNLDKHAITQLRGDLPPVEGYRQTLILGQAAPVLMPLVFLIVWAYLLARILVKV